MSLRITRLICLPSLALLSWAAACGDSGDKPLMGIPPAPIGGGGSGSDAGGVFTKPDGGDNGQVRITILAPTNGMIIRKAIAPELRAQVTSVAATDPIDPTSVAYSITP